MPLAIGVLLVLHAYGRWSVQAKTICVGNVSRRLAGVHRRQPAEGNDSGEDPLFLRSPGGREDEHRKVDRPRSRPTSRSSHDE